MQGLELVALTPNQVKDVWNYIKPMLQRACDRSRGEIDATDLFKSCLIGESTIWVAYDDDGVIHAAGATERQARHDGNVCVITAMGGRSMKDWIGHIETIKNFAKFHGCDRVEFLGRAGWGRVVEGATPVGTIYEVKI